MIEIEKPKVDIVELSEDYRFGKFVFEMQKRLCKGSYPSVITNN